jgi:G3E family GTPase
LGDGAGVGAPGGERGGEADPLGGEAAGVPSADLLTMWSSLVTELDAHRPRPLTSGVEPGHRTAPGPGGFTTTVPVTLVTGFLGAGKSTLLAHLLSAPPSGLLVRAVVNDIGALPFDPTLLASGSDVEIELTNGCGCCQATTDLADALARAASDPDRPDLVVLEASGSADPLALAQVVEATPPVHLDRIVTVVDAGAIEHQLTEPGVGAVVDRQLDAAHTVIVSHTDRVTDADLARVVNTMKARAPGRVVVVSSPDRPATEALTLVGQRGARPTPGGGDVHHDFATATIEPTEPVKRAVLERALARHQGGVVRAKGRVRTDEGHVTVQVSATSLTVAPTEPGPCGLTLVATSDGVIEALRSILET